ncbi:hypothetical protein Taro_046145 [Colocasia esculenta]|uniref:Uncharacterized protein n=1 Tax=Colocasia esculenta TaxID=4460 RepID=A0A843X753_COLES|nr:hypothetical protein [Colocasia esculenta]
MPSVDTSSVGSPRFCVSQARECSGLVPLDSTVLCTCLVERQLDLSSVAARLRDGSFIFLRTRGLISLARLWPIGRRRTRVRLAIRLTGLNGEDRHRFCVAFLSRLRQAERRLQVATTCVSPSHSEL